MPSITLFDRFFHSFLCLFVIPSHRLSLFVIPSNWLPPSRAFARATTIARHCREPIPSAFKLKTEFYIRPMFGNKYRRFFPFLSFSLLLRRRSRPLSEKASALRTRVGFVCTRHTHKADKIVRASFRVFQNTRSFFPLEASATMSLSHDELQVIQKIFQNVRETASSRIEHTEFRQ